MIAIHFIAVLINENASVSIAVERNAEICAMLEHCLGNNFWAGRAAAIIDVGTVGRDPVCENLRAQLFENCGSDPVSSTVGAIEDNLQPGQIELTRESVFQKDDVSTDGVIDTKSLANFFCRWPQRIDPV